MESITLIKMLPKTTTNDTWIGLTLAILSALFIGGSFIIKKISLQRLSQSGRVRAGAGGYGYLKQWLWWAGLLSMGVGEVCNFIAFAFAPAALVTPLGALSVLVTALLSAYCLREPLNLLTKIGCALCILGSTVVVVHAPHSSQVNTLQQVYEQLRGAAYLWLIFICISEIILLMYCSPRYGSKNVLVNILVCSLLGSLTVPCCKILGIAVKECINGGYLDHPLLVVLTVMVLALSVIVQMLYLNRALDIFPTNIVTPVYYVLFTTCVLISSGIIFKEWQGLSLADTFGILAGIFVTVIGVTMLNLLRNVELTKLPTITSGRSHQLNGTPTDHNDTENTTQLMLEEHC